MATPKNSAKAKARKRRKPKPQRKSFVLDHETLTDLGVIQSALRATSTAEALRHTIRKYALLVRHSNKGKQIQVVSPQTSDPPVVVDVPRVAAAGAS